MNLETIAVAALSSGAVAGAVGYVLKKSFETALQARLEAVIREDLRREGLLYQEQAAAYAAILETAYRIRNEVRELAMDNQEWEKLSNGPQFKSIGRYEAELREALYTHRAILPSDFFSLSHDLKAPLHKILLLLDQEARRRRKKQPLNHKNLDEVRASIDTINSIYEALVPKVQKRLGV